MLCRLCGFPVEEDDVVVRHEATGKVICLTCFGRETLTRIDMPKWLHRAVSATLAGIS